MLLYIHIPFCDSKCSYCAFNSYVDKFHLKETYMRSLLTQLEHELQRFHVKEGAIETLFIGGGTPSTVSAKLYEALLERIRPYLKPGAEITAEANPNSATYTWLKGMYALGVNRISFGVQSFDNDKLKTLNRAHRAEDALNAVKNAHDIGYKNLSIDLIYGVAGDTKKMLEKDLESAFSLPINHLSAYALTIEEGTVFEQRPEMANEKLELTQWLFERIASHGFRQYEISNFGTYCSAHNRGYWMYKDYIGLGCGAVGFLKGRRFYPHRDIAAYIDDPLYFTQETLSDEDIIHEKVLLGLRSDVGVEVKSLPESYQKQIALLEQEQKLTCKAGVCYNSDYLLSDELALFITT